MESGFFQRTCGRGGGTGAYSETVKVQLSVLLLNKSDKN